MKFGSESKHDVSKGDVCSKKSTQPLKPQPSDNILSIPNSEKLIADPAAITFDPNGEAAAATISRQVKFLTGLYGFFFGRVCSNFFLLLFHNMTFFD